MKESKKASNASFKSFEKKSFKVKTLKSEAPTVWGPVTNFLFSGLVNFRSKSLESSLQTFGQQDKDAFVASCRLRSILFHEKSVQ